jgi:RecA/RadA recombinase
MSGVDPNLRGEIHAKIEADYGEHTILSGGKMPRPRRLPTGSLALDYVTGGGYIFYGMTRFWGAWSSGKTLAMFLAFISAQNFGELRYRQLMGLSEMALQTGDARDARVLKDQAKREREYGSLSCLFVNAEKSIDVNHMRRLGVDMNKLDIIEDSTIEGISEMVYNSLPAYHVIGIDSTTATMSIDELGSQDGVYGSRPMLHALKWSQAMSWWRARLTRDNVIMFTSHAKEKIGARKTLNSSSKPERPPGGEALYLEPSIVLHFMKGGKLKRKPNGALEELKTDDKRSATASAFSRVRGGRRRADREVREEQGRCPGAQGRAASRQAHRQLRLPTRVREAGQATTASA